ncbi:MAG: hypothetical protein CMJ78_25090 [Planctomycetaceae bacterium]|nr:hypothetical protein [Planctomycetaceae bacterium]
MKLRSVFASQSMYGLAPSFGVRPDPADLSQFHCPPFLGNTTGDMTFSSDGKWLSTKTGYQLKIIDAKTGELAAGPLRSEVNSRGSVYFPKNNQLVTFANNSREEENWKSVARISLLVTSSDG